MQVFVRGPGNSTIVLFVRQNNTVRLLKQLVWVRLRIPVEAQWMESGGRLLHDQMRLNEYGITEESTIWCHLRAGGGVCLMCNQNRQGV